MKKRIKSWLSRRGFALTCALLAAVMLGTIGIQVSDRQDAPQGQFSLGAGQIVITLGHIASAAGAVDYVYDGADDDVQFQAAIDALPATGGRLINVSAVQLNFSATVTRAIDNVIIQGSGRGSYFTNDGVTDLFTAGGDNWKFLDLRTDAGDIGMGATTDWMWTNVTVDVNYYAYRSPYGQSILNDLYLTEQAVALGDVDGLGQLWVKDGTPNALFFTDDAGTDHAILTGVTATKHEFHMPFEDPTGQVGNWDVVSLNASQDTHFVFQVPESFQSLVNAKIVMIPDATETIQWDINVSVSATGEAQDNDTRSAVDQQVAVTADQLTEIDISGQLTGLAPGDYVAIDFLSDTANLRIIGFEFDYG